MVETVEQDEQLHRIADALELLAVCAVMYVHHYSGENLSDTFEDMHRLGYLRQDKR